MIFCGQCGLQLTANDRSCPRCGTIVEPEMLGIGTGVGATGTEPEITNGTGLSQSQMFGANPNDPTKSMASTKNPNSPYPPHPQYAPQEQQKLILRGGAQGGAGDATSMI